MITRQLSSRILHLVIYRSFVPALVIVEELQSVMARLREKDSMAIVLIDQNRRVEQGFAERCVFMNRDRTVCDGSSTKFRKD